MLIHYFVTLDASGLPLEFYNDDVHAVIPEGATEITEEQWQDFIQNTGLRRWDAATSSVVAYAPPAAPVDLKGYALQAQAEHLLAGQTFNVAASGATPVQVLCDGTNDTRADLALLALFGQDNPAGTKTWLDNTGKTTVLTGAQLVTLATLAGNWIADTYPALVGVMGGIAAGTVTTTAEIDAAFAAVTA